MQVEICRFGETTGEALEFIGRAIKCPKREFYEKRFENFQMQKAFEDTLTYLVNQLELDVEIKSHQRASIEFVVKIKSTYPIGMIFPDGDVRMIDIKGRV